MIRLGLLILTAAFLAGGSAVAAEGPADAQGLELFERRIRPLLIAHCLECHGPGKQQASLRLDSLSDIVKGGDRGAAIVPGDPEASLLIQAVRYTDEDLQMPPKGKLDDREIADLTAWIKLGAPGPTDRILANPANASGSEQPAATFDMAQRQKHWAWQPAQAVEPPTVSDPTWPLAPLDRFILARLDQAGLTPAPAADKRTWLRRVTFDLIGLPPSVDEAAAFLADESPQASAKVVDRLLASPHYGERWGRHWLDLARYAETRGHEYDFIIPNAWQYRDYVIRALNADVPYDQFLIEHVAGDLVDPPRTDAAGANESILATGFWYLGEEVHSPVDIRNDQVERIDNKIDVFTKTFLGMTVACARCHDHKFDAIRANDYYALSGYLLSCSYRQAPFETMEHNRRIAGELAALRREHQPAIVKAVAEAQQPMLEHLADYLLAARDVIRGGAVENPRADKLDPARVQQWVERVKAAHARPYDPLHAWALVAHDAEAPTAERLTSLMQPLADRWQSREAEMDKALDAVDVVVDYSRLGPEDWLQDGVAFGERPVQPGDVLLSADAARPIEGIFTRSAARKDPIWDVLALTADTQREPGSISWMQSGRTLRTRTFTLSRPKLCYLVRGSASAYAAIGQHRLVNGPLHAALVRDWKGTEQLQWVEHDLAAYVDQRVHVEFTPREAGMLAGGESAGMEILMVVQADGLPAILERPNRLIGGLIAKQNLASIEAFAKAYQDLLLDVSARLATDAIKDADQEGDYARLADWLIREGDLFGASDEAARGQVAAAAEPFVRRQAELVALIRPTSHTAPALLEGSGVDESVLLRGNHKTPGEAAPRRFLEAIAGADQPNVAAGSGRLELARRMVDPANPLVARVLVNRLWHHLFGQGIVASVDNFGVLGEEPTHPDLLDHLALRFVSEGWSIKRVIREIVLSRTYGMSSAGNENAMAADPRNLLLHRMRVRRLEGEAIRDSLLAVSGRLDRRLYGPSVEIHLTAFMEGRGRPESGPLDGDGRRSIYLRVRRNFLPSMLLAFDFPTPFTTIGRRTVSNVPAQALTLMNGPLVVQQASLWADRVLADGERSPAERIDNIYLTALSRPPTAEERAAALDFLTQQSERYGSQSGDDPRAWADLCHVLLNVKEFIYIR